MWKLGVGTEAPIFLFWEYLFQIFDILSLQCTGTGLLQQQGPCNSRPLQQQSPCNSRATAIVGQMQHQEACNSINNSSNNKDASNIRIDSNATRNSRAPAIAGSLQEQRCQLSWRLNKAPKHNTPDVLGPTSNKKYRRRKFTFSTFILSVRIRPLETQPCF
jgi:hypothetical protein